MHPAKNNRLRIRSGRALREPERIRDVVCHFLNLGTLVVMRQDDGLAFPAKLPNALLLGQNFFRRVVYLFDRRKGIAVFVSFTGNGCWGHGFSFGRLESFTQIERARRMGQRAHGDRIHTTGGVLLDIVVGNLSAGFRQNVVEQPLGAQLRDNRGHLPG